MRALAECYQENNLFLNKTKELIVDFRKQQSEHTPIHIDMTAVEKVDNFKFLGVHTPDNLKWSNHTDSVMKESEKMCLDP